jgi:hypothetical protein
MSAAAYESAIAEFIPTIITNFLLLPSSELPVKLEILKLLDNIYIHGKFFLSKYEQLAK